MDIHKLPDAMLGCESFEKLITSNAYYVDKTFYLNTLFMERCAKNTFITRPGRFGKTMNLSMIKAFCELNYKNPGDTSYQQKLFIDNSRNLAVARDEYKELRDKVMGQFPVIYVSFKGIEGSCFYEAVEKTLPIIARLYNQFYFLTQSRKQLDVYIEYFKDILTFSSQCNSNLCDKENLCRAVTYCGYFIPTLAHMLHKEFGREVLFLLDDYDFPLQKAVEAEEPYYDKMLAIIKNISINTFKQDPDGWLYRSIITSSLNIIYQSIYGGGDANNYVVFSVEDYIYSTFFGFTHSETDKILCDFGIESKGDVIKKWYGSYRFGDDYVYCPWSLMKYCFSLTKNNTAKPESYWVNTSGNDIITLYTQKSIETNKAGNTKKLQELMDGKAINIDLCQFNTYPDIKNYLDFESFCNLLLHKGYVTFDENSKLRDTVSVKIPNYEVKKAFETKFLTLYSDTNTSWKNDSEALLDAIMSADAKKTHELINQTLQTYISIRHSGYEQYYHDFMLGLLIAASASKNLEIIDEGESGNGYYDLALRHKFNNIAAIIEFKVEKDKDLILKGSSQKALSQIIEKKYAMKFFKRGCDRVICIGMTFRQKECQLIFQTISDQSER